MTQELNMSNKRLVVDSLEVLNNISGSGITQIKRSISSMQQAQKSSAARQKKYWKKLSDDGIITPFEKTELLKEFRGIQQSYNAIFTQAQAQNLAGTDYFLFYKETYEQLYNYLYTELKLFDDMNKDTELESRTVFDGYFSNYYFAESSVNVSMAIGIFGNLGFKTLNSLDAPGNEGDVGLYQGQIYQYSGGQWIAQGLEGYQGTRSSLPSLSSENNYFLAEEDFIAALPVKVNDDLLYVNGEQLYFNVLFQKGVIYVSRGNGWRAVQDTTNYRYVVALVDYLNVTGELPGAYNVAIQNKVNETIAQEGLVNHIPEYLGPSAIDPAIVNEGDFYLYTGVNKDTPPRLNCYIYLYRNSEWEQLEPNDPTKSSYYMQALDDILKTSDTASSGVFSSIFASTFFAHQGILNSLKTKTIYLENTGAIQTESPGYVANRSGVHIGANGHADFNEDVHIGGNCNIDGVTKIGGQTDINGTTNITGDVTIGGNASFFGKINATSGIFRGEVQATGGTFNGTINATDGKFTGSINAYKGLSFSKYRIEENTNANRLYNYLFENMYGYNKSFFATGAVIFRVIANGAIGMMNICRVQNNNYGDSFVISGFLTYPELGVREITLNGSSVVNISGWECNILKCIIYF